MARTKGKLLGVIYSEKGDLSVRISEHGKLQMIVRNVNEFDVLQSINDYGVERLQNTAKKVAVVNKEKDITIIAEWNDNKLIIVTVIDTAQAFLKKPITKVCV